MQNIGLASPGASLDTGLRPVAPQPALSERR